MRVVVATHGHCFDGLVSAACFTRLLRAREGKRHEFEYRACGYGFGQQRADEAVLTGDQNVILDYRLAPSPRVTWAFDHHRTAFQVPGSREVYDAGRERERMFVDVDYSSCAKLIMDVAREHIGFREPSHDDAVAWAAKVDAARFDSPGDAIDQRHPIKRLVAVVEHQADDAFVNHLVPRVLEEPLAEIAGSRYIRERYEPLGKRRAKQIELIRSRCERRGRVVYADLRDRQLDAAGKFVGYALHPDSVYSVMVGRQGKGAKVLVGYNPWCGVARDFDLSVICARHGGGGHPYVGAIPFRASEHDRAVEVARLIASELVG
jgi:hypothetical protein